MPRLSALDALALTTCRRALLVVQMLQETLRRRTAGMTGFVDVLTTALLEATEELFPSAAHMDRRAPALAAHMAQNPCITRLFNAAGEVDSVQTSGDGAASTARPPAEHSEVHDAMHDTQLPLAFAESSGP